MKHYVQAALLMLVGGTLLRIAIAGTYTDYVKPGLGLPLALAGSLVGGLGSWSALTDAPIASTDRPSSEDDRDHAPGHRRGHGGPRVAWLLTLPVFTLHLVAPPALGAYAADLDPVSVPRPSHAGLPGLPAGDPVSTSVGEFAIRAVWYDGETLEGRNVRMIGFVTPRPDGTWDLTRMHVSCCAADARPTRIHAVGAEPLPRDTWVEVVGHWIRGGGTQTESAVPFVRVARVTVVDAPKNPYE